MVYFSGQPTKASLSIKFQQTNHYTEKCTIGKCVQYPTVRVILLPLPRRQVPFRIWKLGGRVRNQTRVNLSRMILEEIMVSSHNLLSSLIDQASTCVFYTSGPVLGNAGGRGGGAQQRPKLTWSFYLGSLYSNREDRYWRVRNENRGTGEWGEFDEQKRKRILKIWYTISLSFLHLHSFHHWGERRWGTETNN